MSIIVKDIEVGDVHYESEYGITLIVKVISPIVSVDVTKEFGELNGKPRFQHTWESQVIESKQMTVGQVVDYRLTDGMEHYGPSLYDYQAYIGMK